MKKPIVAVSALAAMTVPLTALPAEPSSEGKAAYQAVCASCHDVGMMGAPVTGSPDDWAAREPAGEAALQQHAEKGLLRGGIDDTAKRATEYMRAVTVSE